MIETFISSEYVEYDTIESHVLYIDTIPYIPSNQFSIVEVDEDGLLSAVLISVLSDARWPFSADAPLTAGDRRGWWGDLTLPIENDKTGSQLWTLSRWPMSGEKILTEAKRLAEESLRWLLDDQVAEWVNVGVERESLDTLKFSVDIKRPNVSELDRYHFVWKQVAESVGEK